MNIHTGRFAAPEDHHVGWFRVFRCGWRIVEVWLGERWIMVDLT